MNINRLKHAIDVSGISQTDLARLAKISRSSLCKYLTGERMPKIEQINSLANVLGVDPDWLAGRDVPIRTEDDTKLMREIAEAMQGLSERQLVLLLAYIKLLRGEHESS